MHMLFFSFSFPLPVSLILFSFAADLHRTQRVCKENTVIHSNRKYIIMQKKFVFYEWTLGKINL